MQYLTIQESVRRLKAAGMDVRPQTIQSWIRDRKVRDVLVLGRHTFIYDEELERAIRSEQAA